MSSCSKGRRGRRRRGRDASGFLELFEKYVKEPIRGNIVVSLEVREAIAAAGCRGLAFLDVPTAVSA